MLPLVPVTVIVKGPVAASLAVLTSKVDEPLPPMLVGLNVPVAPDPKPAAVREMVPEKPFVGVAETV
jgi:hypothetical protein